MSRNYNKHLREIGFEFKYLFSPLKNKNKRYFIYILLLMAVFLVLSLFVWIYWDTISFQANFDKSILSNVVVTILSVCVTIFFGVIIALRVSTNNLSELLSKIATMLSEANETDELFIILPTPFLGAAKYKKYHKIISDYLLDKKGNNNYKLAFLDNKDIDNSFYDLKGKLEKMFKEKGKGMSKKLSKKEKEKNIGILIWEDYEDLVSLRRTACILLPDLLQFHLDEVDKSVFRPEEKYRYLYDFGIFMDQLKCKSNKVSCINIKYDYLSTVFPIIIVNKTKKMILLGTVRVESQTIVKFEGDVIENAADLCSKASDIFSSFTV